MDTSKPIMRARFGRLFFTGKVTLGKAEPYDSNTHPLPGYRRRQPEILEGRARKLVVRPSSVLAKVACALLSRRCD